MGYEVSNRSALEENIAAIEGGVGCSASVMLLLSPGDHVVTGNYIYGGTYRLLNHIMTVPDNTFLSPCFQRPISLGVDMVIHSTTKYINGHGDIGGGAIVYRTKKLEGRDRYIVNATGTARALYNSWPTLRGVKTLAPRMETRQKTARAIPTTARLRQPWPDWPSPCQ